MAFRATYPGICKRAGCGDPIVVGQMIVAYNRPAKGTWMHASPGDCLALKDSPRGSGGYATTPLPWEPEELPTPQPTKADAETEAETDTESEATEPSSDSKSDAVPPHAPPPPASGEPHDDLFETIFKRSFERLDKHDYLRTGPEIDRILRDRVKDAMRGFRPTGGREVRSLTITVKQAEIPDVSVPTVHKDFPRILRMLAGTTKHLYVWGPPGSGKSTAVKQAAKALGRDYYYRSLAPSDTPSKLEGFIDVHGVVRDTEFVRLVRDGGIVCLEEVDNAASSLLVVLNNVLENGQASFPGGMVPVHKDFRLVACANTSGRGGDVLFPERRPLDSAFLDRFYKVHFGYDEALELDIATAQFGQGVEAWVSWVQRARQWAVENKRRVIISPRASFAGLAAAAAGETIDDIVQGTVLSGVAPDIAESLRTAVPWSGIIIKTTSTTETEES